MEVFNLVVNSGTMDQPKEIADADWDLIKVCFEFDPLNRPTFPQILERLTDAAQNDYELYESSSV